MLGEFLELSVSTTEILASIRFLEKLGFSSATVGETWSHPYAVMGDGRLMLGLHVYDFASPSLTFVLPELNRQLAALEQAGITFSFCKLADDEFNEAGFADPDQQTVTLLEARTFSPLPPGTPASLCGYFLEYRLGVQDCESSRAFWERLGLVTTHADGTTASYAQLATGGLNLGLIRARQAPQLVFVQEKLAELPPLLEARDLVYRKAQDHDGTAILQLTSPDGLVFILRERE